MAHGTFYLHFKNRAEVAQAVLHRYYALARVFRPRAWSKLSRYQTIYQANRYYVGLYAENAALLAGREILSRELSEKTSRGDWINARWSRIVARDVAKRMKFAEGFDNSEISGFVVRCAIAMADQMLSQIFVYRSPSLQRLAEDKDQLAELMSFVWYRIVYGETPDKNELNTMADFSALFRASNKLLNDIQAG
jgi:AcrR family transcriptional regulator